MLWLGLAFTLGFALGAGLVFHWAARFLEPIVRSQIAWDAELERERQAVRGFYEPEL